MIYSDFNGKKLSLLGFGAMRLPLKSQATDDVDEAQVREMVRYALEQGVNYFDTAYPYHGGVSERVLGRALKEFPRESFFLATKFPGHQISKSYNPQAIFEEQLEKCGVDYFDFYLLHNVYEKSIDTYREQKWGIVDYLLEQKKNGRIRHLGFSCHGRMENLREFLDLYGEQMEFCQIQLNYLDWTLQNAKEKYDLLTERGIPVWVMEPLRGGKLANLSDDDAQKLKALRSDETIPAWGFRFLQGLPNVKMILSGMSAMEQMVQNVQTFEERKPLNDEELQTIFAIADGLKNAVPCTACRYCCDGCPQGLDIPMLISAYNDLRVAATINVGMAIEALPQDKQPSACVKCGKCAKQCPQGIDIPSVMQDFAERLSKLPSWAEICRQRDEANARNR